VPTTPPKAPPKAPPADSALRPGRPVVFRVCNFVARMGFRLARTRVTVEGAERVPDLPGIILASNHLSILDPVLLTLAIEDLTKRRIRYMAKAEALAWPGFGPLLKAYGGFAVHRGRPDTEAYRMAQEIVHGGDWLGLAPEGTRSRTGALIEPKPGVALLAMRTGAPILPVGIWGTERVWPVGARLPRFGQAVTIRFGEPYDPRLRPERKLAAAAPRAAAAAGADATASAGMAEGAEGGETAVAAEPAGRRQRVDAATEDLMFRIAALLPPTYRGRFG
jgi:1-acyl-sn-glycerol-3-phosphate acyltransferase